MLVIHRLEWSNFFSYGANNSIQLDNNPLTQILGTNGKGKSSIPVILEEVLFGKNSKGFKKTEIPNRYIDSPTLSGKVTFSVDNDFYEVDIVRKSTLKLILKKNGEDISFHTTTNTYKHIEDIIGMDFKSFTQIVYQSATSNLQFLTATDTNRKKFLISLFNLSEYLEYHEKFKAIAKGLNTEVNVTAGKVAALQDVVAKILKHSKIKVPLEQLPDEDRSLEDRSLEIKTKLASLANENKIINNNEQFKKLRDAIDSDLLISTEQVCEHEENLATEFFKLGGDIKSIKENIKKMKNLGVGDCPTCKQSIHTGYIHNTLDILIPELEALTAKEGEIRVSRDNILKIKTSNKAIVKAKEEFERLAPLIDDELPSKVYDPKVMKAELVEINAEALKLKKLVEEIKASNTKAERHNISIDLREVELDSTAKTLEELLLKNVEISKQLSNADILKNAFGTNGLVSFKLEYLVKDLEGQINKYLADLSDGRFQLQFTLVSEKLNIDIIDNGATITVNALSAGELARVNVATLLAIRKMMSIINASRINVLFLDEVMGVLDAEGKDLLTELLLKEEYLNTFLVSHDYSHPLIPTISIAKVDNISEVLDG